MNLFNIKSLTFIFKLFLFSILFVACKQKKADTKIQEYFVKSFTKYSDSLFIIKELDLYEVPDSVFYDSSRYFRNKLIVFHNIKENYSDTIQYHYNNDIEYINEISEELKLNYPIFCIKYIDYTGFVTKEYFNISQNQVVKMFDIENYHDFELLRYNDSLLTGYIVERDTLVNHFQKYKFYLNLNTYEMKIIYPIRNYIDFKTITRNEIILYKDLKLSNKFILKQNENIYIDSAYYDLRVLKLIYKNNTYYISFDSIYNNIGSNGAG